MAEGLAVDASAAHVADDARSFAAWMKEHEGMVFSLAYHFLQNRAAAEDLSQDVFLRLYQNLHTIQSPAHLKFWLRQVTSRRCIDLARRARLLRFLSLQDLPDPVAEVEFADPTLEEKLRKLVSTLPPRPRMIMVLRYQEDLEPSEIATLLGISPNTVKSSIRRALALLREKLERQLGAKP
jgi:RNA polymerase sigma-70 factor (ECF subfamily)